MRKRICHSPAPGAIQNILPLEAKLVVRRVWISMPLNGSFIRFTSCPSSAAHPSVWFRHFCFRVCVPERLADKIWLDVAWSENVSKKKTGVPRKKRGHQIEYAREAKGRAFLSESCGITGTQFNVYRLLEQHGGGR